MEQLSNQEPEAGCARSGGGGWERARAHLSWTDNVEEAVKELKANGVRILQDVNSPAPGVKLAYVLGAGDITIELLEKD